MSSGKSETCLKNPAGTNAGGKQTVDETVARERVSTLWMRRATRLEVVEPSLDLRI